MASEVVNNGLEVGVAQSATPTHGAKMCEALKEAKYVLQYLYKPELSPIDGDNRRISEAVVKIDAALAAPPEPQGDGAKMREALNKIAHYDESEYSMDDYYCADGHVCAAIARDALAALAAPARNCEAASIERLVRDAIIDYQEMYASAPNDDCERELVERAKRGNDWLVVNGFEPEELHFPKSAFCEEGGAK